MLEVQLQQTTLNSSLKAPFKVQFLLSGTSKEDSFIFLSVLCCVHFQTEKFVSKKDSCDVIGSLLVVEEVVHYYFCSEIAFALLSINESQWTPRLSSFMLKTSWWKKTHYKTDLFRSRLFHSPQKLCCFWDDEKIKVHLWWLIKKTMINKVQIL